MVLQNDEFAVSGSNIDLTYLKKFSNGDKSFEKDMLESSLHEAAEKMEILNVHLANGEYKNIKALSHSLKSLMYVMGAQNLYHHFNIIEDIIEQTGFEDRVNKQYHHINDSWLIFKDKIENLIKQYQLTLHL